MSRDAWRIGAAVVAVVLGGCVDRRYVITSDPPGAIVLRNYERRSPTPSDDHFLYYGTYHFTLIAPGYSTLQVNQEIKAPWFEYFPLDFISENLVPWRIEDTRRFHYTMQPLQIPNTAEAVQRGEQLRIQGKALNPTIPPPPPVPSAPAAPTPVQRGVTTPPAG